jgi:hypothetical protein
MGGFRLLRVAFWVVSYSLLVVSASCERRDPLDEKLITKNEKPITNHQKLFMKGGSTTWQLPNNADKNS